MLEDEHREICFLDDTTDPHGERRFKRSCIDYYNEIMAERSQVPTIPQYARDDSTGGTEMKVLVACEESQRVCQAFRNKGHEAYSCDIVPTRGSHTEWHIHEDVISVLVRDSVQNALRENIGGSNWDLLIAHPPCTYLCNSGVRWLFNKDGSINSERWEKMKDAAEFFKKLWLCNIPKIAIENPIMHGYAKAEAGIRFCYDTPEFKQVIQPWQFGHGETKATCLWLKNLPKLVPTNIVQGREQRVHRMPPGPNRARDRARTYPGIAEAMADQWGSTSTPTAQERDTP